MPEQATPVASIVEALLTNLVAAVKPQITDLRGQSWEEIEAAIRTRTTGLRERNAARAIDGPSQQWLLVSSLVLAVYQELRPLVGDAQGLLSTLRDAMAAPFKGNNLVD